MKTTLDISDSILRKVETAAARRGKTLQSFVCEALQEKVAKEEDEASAVKEPDWMKHFGTFGNTSKTRNETRRIQELIDEEFERIEPEDAA